MRFVVVSMFTKRCLFENQTARNSFGASTQDLLDLVDWLTANQCEAVAMESTASYWKPVFIFLKAMI